MDIDNETPESWLPGILADQQIAYLAQNNNMISPFVEKQVKENGVISYGLSSYGYDVRISDEFKIIPNEEHYRWNNSEEYQKVSIETADIPLENADFNIFAAEKVLAKHFGYPIYNKPIIDPTDFDPTIFKDLRSSEIIIPPHSFVLARTIETFIIPRDVLVICMTKSTWARTGLVIGVTPIEAGFEGTVTIELSNTNNLPIRVQAGHGICQFLFFKGSTPCEVSYADRGGKYMYQTEVTPPRIVK